MDLCCLFQSYWEMFTNVPSEHQHLVMSFPSMHWLLDTGCVCSASLIMSLCTTFIVLFEYLK